MICGSDCVEALKRRACVASSEGVQASSKVVVSEALRYWCRAGDKLKLEYDAWALRPTRW